MKEKDRNGERERSKKFNPLEAIVEATQRDYNHLHSAQIKQRYDLVEFELQQIDAKLETLHTTIQIAKDRRKKLQAILVGLAKVRSSRC